MILINLGFVHGILLEAEQARIYLERALPILELYYGAEHSMVVLNLAYLGAAYVDLGNAEQGKIYLERALSLLKSHFDLEHPNMSMIFNNLGAAYGILGNLGEAEAYLKWALAIKEQYYGGEHFHITIILTNLSLVYEAYERVITLSPETTTIYHNAACCSHVLGEKEKAREYFEKGIALCPTAGLHVEYAHYLLQEGSYKEALKQLVASKRYEISELGYGSMDKGHLAPLLQKLMDKGHENLVFPTDGLTHYLAYACYMELNRKDLAEKARNALAAYVENTHHELLGELYGLVLSLEKQEEQSVAISFSPRGSL